MNNPELTSGTLTVHRDGPLYYVCFPAFEKTGLVRHLYSTRRGGVSQGYLGSMNLGFNRGDSMDNVLENYRRICFSSGIYPGDMVFSDQIHRDVVLAVDGRDRGKGMTRPKEMEGVDALVTDTPQVCLVTTHADCAALFFLDPVRKAIGLAHAGWKGTAMEIGRKTVEKMTECYGCDPKDILAGISPSIGPCCFEVDVDVASIFESMFPEWAEDIILPGKAPEKAQIDLWETNRRILLKAGLREENIAVTDLCTMCQEEYFHSHRRMGKKRGTQMAFLELI
ncbi:MAG: peptidoglycan editing factor PgeF [Lachnospiraceae bacterium]|nr:peptidoglycan editing factor PgeF [Lachnospiraceae bacterium]